MRQLFDTFKSWPLGLKISFGWIVAMIIITASFFPMAMGIAILFFGTCFAFSRIIIYYVEGS